MAEKSRINGIDRDLEEMAEGNKGAISILTSIVEQSRTVDPNSEPLWYIMMLDRLGVYGKQINKLFNRCKNNLSKMIGLVHAYHLGLIKKDSVMKLLADPIDVNKICRIVQSEVPGFVIKD